MTDIVISQAAIELCKMANGGDDITLQTEQSCRRYLTPERAQSAIDLTKVAMSKAMDTDELAKSVTLATGATYYNLRAPSLLFSPTITPVRNSLKRTVVPMPGTGINYKVITGLSNTPNLMGWTPEGRRSGSINYNMTNAIAGYATLGTEDSVTDEAKYAAVGFEDEEALIQLRSLYKLMQIEECSLLHGNNSVPLGTPATPTVSVAGSTGTLPALTYSVIVVALSHQGFQQMTAATGLMTSVSVTSNDGQGAYTLNGGVSNKSAAASQAVTLGQILSATATYINGAAGYAWFVGLAGSETLQTITTLNSATFSAPLATGRQAATAIVADYSVNTLAFDGLVTQAFKNNTVAYINTLSTGVAGVGTQLTSVGNGEVTEIRTMLKAMWDQYRVGVSRIYVNSQELQSLTKLVMTSGSSPMLTVVQHTQDAPADTKVTGGAAIGWYFNPYTADGGKYIPIIIHPNMVAGTIFGYAEQLPPTYMSNETPTVAELLIRQDYYVEKWPKTSRTQFYGTYVQEGPAVYAPFCLAIINNIAPTP
jgi:hypothetical protein